MAYGLVWQLEPGNSGVFFCDSRPWRNGRKRSGRTYKLLKVRAERRRARLDPECQPLYTRYRGYEY